MLTKIVKKKFDPFYRKCNFHLYKVLSNQLSPFDSYVDFTLYAFPVAFLIIIVPVK